jgi:VanZ family protein
VKSALRRWIPAVLWTAVLFALSSQPALPVDLGSGLDKVAHFGAYAVLGVLLGHALHARSGGLLLAILIGSTLGALDEVYQDTIPGRTTEVLDWVADTAGVITGVLVHLFFARLHGRGSRIP